MNHITVMKQALDALEKIPTSFGNVAYTASVQSAIEALRAAIDLHDYVPLTDGEIRKLQAKHPTENDPMAFARAIEQTVKESP